MRRSQVTRLGRRRRRQRAARRRGDGARLHDARSATASEIDEHDVEAQPRRAHQRRARRRQRRASSPSACASASASTRAVLSGEEEAQLTFLGATSGRAGRGPSRRSSSTSAAARPSSSSATGAGRLPRLDPGRRGAHERAPPPRRPARRRDELQGSPRTRATMFARAPPRGAARARRSGIAVAGTATSAAAIDQELDPYDPARVARLHA